MNFSPNSLMVSREGGKFVFKIQLDILAFTLLGISGKMAFPDSESISEGLFSKCTNPHVAGNKLSAS